MSDPIRPLCHRPIPVGVLQSHHLLIPKLKGGKGRSVILRCDIRRREFHARQSEALLRP